MGILLPASEDAYKTGWMDLCLGYFFKLLFSLPAGIGGPTAPPVETEEKSTPGAPSTGATSTGKAGKSGCAL